MSADKSALAASHDQVRREIESFGRQLLETAPGKGNAHWPEERMQLNYTGASGAELMRRTIDFVDFLGREVPALSSGRWCGLDYGVGWGRIASVMRYFGPAENLDCADAWQKSLDFARQCGLANQMKLLPARLAGGELPCATYDLIYSYSIFTHLPDTHIVSNLTHLMSALKSNGKLVFTLRQPKFIDFLRRSNKFVTADDRVDTDGYWFGNCQSPDYGDTLVTDAWIERNLGHLGNITRHGPLATEPFQAVTVLTKA